MRGFVEERRNRIGGADRVLVGDVAAEFGPDQGHAFVERLGRIDDRRVRVVRDGDSLQRFPRAIFRVGDNHRHGIADMAHAILRQHGIIRQRHLFAVGIRHRREARDAAQMRDIFRRQHQPHAGHRAHGSEIADRKSCMRVRRAQEAHGERALLRNVGGVHAGAGDEARVLDPAHRLSHSEFCRLHAIHSACARKNIRCPAPSSHPADVAASS